MALAFPAARPRQLSLYPHEIRKRCIHQRLNLGFSYEAIAASYGNRPSARSIKVWVKEAIQQGTIPVHLGRHGLLQSTRKASDFAKLCLGLLCDAREQSRLVEFACQLCDMTRISFSVSDVAKMFKEMNYSRKKLINRAVEADPVKRQQYRDSIKRHGLHGPDLIFGDESSVDDRNTNVKYAWGRIGARSQGCSLFVRGQRYTVVAEITEGGLLSWCIVAGSCTKEIFMTHFVDDVVPKMKALYQGPSIYVADNGSSHDFGEMARLASAVGGGVARLPPYSPDFNPIEKFWGTFKQWIRANRDWVFQADPVFAITEGLNSISAAQCKNWIRFEPDLY